MGRNIISKLMTILLILTFAIYLNTNNIMANENLQEKTITYEKYLESELKNIKRLSQVKLDSTGQKIYQDIYNAISNVDYEINLSKYPDYYDYFDISWKVINENPELFYVQSMSYSWNSQGDMLIRFKYSYNKSSIKKFQEKVSNILNTIITPNMTELEKEIAIHDYIVLNTSYDRANYINRPIPSESYTAYGVIINGTGVCSGYAKAMQLLLNKVGIECSILSVPEMDHAWNIVTIGGKKYHLDVTWNDPVPDRQKKTRYKYFNIDDEIMSQDHIWNKSRYPKCTSKDYLYINEIGNNYPNASFDSGYFYYLDYNNEQSLMKVKADGSSTSKVIDRTYLKDFMIDGEYIYYWPSYWGEEYNKNGIYRANKDGSGITKISDKFGDILEIDKEWIYFQDIWEGNTLCRVKKNGINNVENIFSKPMKYISINGEWIYFANESDNKKLYRIKNDGSNLSKLSDDSVSDIYTDRNRLNYLVIDEITGRTNYKYIWMGNTGWHQQDGLWYYYNTNGQLHKGWLNLSGTWYYFDYNGVMINGWQYINNRWYFLGESGAMKTGWLNLNGTWYYLRSNGVMATGWEKVGNRWYYLTNSGAMKTGWLKLNGVWYYLDSSGKMLTGWQKISNKWYYFYGGGNMATNTVIDGWKINGSGVATPMK